MSGGGMTTRRALPKKNPAGQADDGFGGDDNRRGTWTSNPHRQGNFGDVKLRRKHGQSIRYYNAEYDRLYVRLKEVGCVLPEKCAAWLYVDRLHLEEGVEPNLLASVGNVYNLKKLQKAAIIPERGLQKPLEGGGKGGRKPYTAQVTDAGEDVEQPLGDIEDEELEAIPEEEVAVAYMTFQKAKYKEQAQSRGYRGDGTKDHGKDGGKGSGQHAEPKDKAREEKLKQIKARSFCSGCGCRGPCDDAGTGRDDEARGLSAEDLRLEPCVQYMVHAVAVTSCKPPALYSLHYEKKISHLNMPELKLKVRVLGVEYPENVTKEDLLQLVRDSINTQVPWQYGRWASNEVKTSAKRTRRGDVVIACECLGGDGLAEESDDRGTPRSESMDDEPDQETFDEIKKLETRLAILKSKTKAKGPGPGVVTLTKAMTSGGCKVAVGSQTYHAGPWLYGAGDRPLLKLWFCASGKPALYSVYSPSRERPLTPRPAKQESRGTKADVVVEKADPLQLNDLQVPTRWRWPAGPSATRAGVDTQQCSLRDTFERLSQEQMQRIEKLLQLVELLRAFPDPMCWHPAMMGVPGQLHFLALECVGLLAPACTCPPVFAHGLWAGMAHFLRWRLVCLVFVMMPPTQDRADAVTLPARLILAWGGGFSESHLTASRTGLQRRFSAGPPVPPRARSPVTGPRFLAGDFNLPLRYWMRHEAVDVNRWRRLMQLEDVPVSAWLHQMLTAIVTAVEKKDDAFLVGPVQAFLEKCFSVGLTWSFAQQCLNKLHALHAHAGAATVGGDLTTSFALPAQLEAPLPMAPVSPPPARSCAWPSSVVASGTRICKVAAHVHADQAEERAALGNDAADKDSVLQELRGSTEPAAFRSGRGQTAIRK
ncbi:unnamed protein product, partial [Symbiodinium sp. KB8]